MIAGQKKSALNLKSARLPTTGYARALKFMFIRPELGGKVQDVYFSLHTVKYVSNSGIKFEVGVSNELRGDSFTRKFII